MSRLWEWFEEQFGAAFTTQYGEKASVWMRELNRAKVRPTHVKFALSVLIQRGERMPPNLNEFRKLCKTAKTATAAHRPYKSLPKPKADAEQAAQCAAKARELLR